MTTAEPRWRKSSYSGGDNNCVELATIDSEHIAIRDSKNLAQPPLFFPRAALAAFVDAVKSGEFDANQ